MSHIRVLLADRLSEEGIAPLRAEPTIELVEKTGLSGESLADALAESDAVIVRSSTQITREALTHADRLRVIGRAGVGVDNIDVTAATERGIAVLNAPSGNTISAAEMTMALLLSVVRRVPDADRSMRNGQWNRRQFLGTELFGKTLGLVGAGRIGGEVAKRARAYGMSVVAYDPFLSEERAESLGIELDELHNVLERADALSLHTPLTGDTAGLIDAEAIQRLRKGAYIINAARGGVLDEDALIDALRDGHLAGAALDVYETEPLPADHPLRSLDNVVLTPHLGAATAEAQQNVAVEVAEAVRDALLEGDLSRAVNAPAIGGETMRRLRPLLDLSERLGTMASALGEGGIESVEIRYAGGREESLRPLATSVLVGMLSEFLGKGAVNFVNAAHLAETRGIEVARVRVPQHSDYAEYLEVHLSGGGKSNCVAGALLAEGYPRLVRIDTFKVDMAPRGSLVVLWNRDVPGVIGRVGTLLGRAEVNIAGYHQARLEPGGKALAVVKIDDRLPAEVAEALVKIPEVSRVEQVELS